MGDPRTIEDVLDRELPVASGMPFRQVDALHTATEDGPVFSADGSLAVIRTDPELAEQLLEIARSTPTLHAGWENRALRRAAALLAAPAPADPEED